MKTLLVTGASGFIGRQILASHVVQGYRIHAVSRNPVFLPGHDIEWHEAELLSSGAARTVMERVKPTHLLHLAWYSEPGKYWLGPENYSWLRASIELAEAFQEFGGRKMVIAGTCAEYDWSYGCCLEATTPVLPPVELNRVLPEFVLVLPWNIKDGIMAAHSHVRDWSGIFVTAVPEVEIL